MNSDQTLQTKSIVVQCQYPISNKKNLNSDAPTPPPPPKKRDKTNFKNKYLPCIICAKRLLYKLCLASKTDVKDMILVDSS